ncbi:limonene-1,2-epoxide hydrolase family protein [soil metagenome]
MTEQTTDVSTDTNTAVVEKFLFALRDKDLGLAGEQLAENLVYQNVGFPTIHGSRRAMKLFAGMQRPSLGFDVAIHRAAAEGASVLTERTDVLVIGPVRLQFWVCGVFEVHDGRITLWRDYFDMFDFVKAIARGVLGAAVPALRPSL